MLTWEEDVEAHALRKQGWTITAIARHLHRDRKTIRAYLAGKRTPGGRRVRAVPDRFEPFAEYCRIRLADDPHLWASTLFDEVRALGYEGAYPSFTRALRARRLRPHCEACAASRGRDHAIIDHPAGAETQFDWLELPDPPAGWGWDGQGHLLVGALAHSSRWRAVLAESEDQAHLVEAIDAVVRRLGGCTRRWRFDRMATVCHPESGRITASFAQVAGNHTRGPSNMPSWPSTTGSGWTSARPGTATARAWWRRATTRWRNAGGAPWPTTWIRPGPSPAWTSSASASATPAGAPWTRPAARSGSWPRPSS